MGGYRPSVNEVRETVAAQRRQTTLNQYPNDLATLREAVSLQRRQASLLTQHTAEIAELRKTVQALQKQLANRNDLPASVKAAASRFASYQPAASTNCHGVLPCLHTTPGERIAAGCLEAVWDGHFGRHGTRYEPARWAGENSTSFMRPVAPPFSVRRWPDVKAQFYPAIGDQCDLADVWALSKLHPDRVKQAVEAHWNMRLRGVKNSLWLFLGSSIDLDGLKQTCLAFGETYITLESPPTKIFPRPGLISYHCRVPPLNLTLVAVALNAMTSAKTQQEESLQHERYGEIQGHLTRHGWHGGPTFLSFGGEEWDFKNWRCAYPQNDYDWQRVLQLLNMQARAARTFWPSIRSLFTRTIFKPTYGTFGCSCCAKEADFYHMNNLLRLNGHANVSSNATTADLPASEARSVCERVHVLDLQRMMKCNDTHGTCSGRSGWTGDGLHPSQSITLQYVGLAFNIASDLGQLC